MKTIKILVLLAIVLAFSSCSKQTDTVEPDKTEKLYDVKLSVSTFDTQIVPLSSAKLSSTGDATGTMAAATVGDQINNLEYAIFNSSGLMVKNATQTKSLLTFGNISEQLPAGTYKIYLAGSTESFYMGGKESNTTSTSMYINPGSKNGDLFTKVIEVKVLEEAISQNVTLDRAVGKLEVVITDAIPANTAKITVTSSTVSTVYFSLLTFEITGNNKTVETILTSGDIGKTNFTVSNYIVPSTSGTITSDVSIRAYNATGGLIVDKIVKDVKVEKNKKTIMTGKLFTSAPAATTGFAIQLNADWNTATNNVSF